MKMKNQLEMPLSDMCECVAVRRQAQILQEESKGRTLQSLAGIRFG